MFSDPLNRTMSQKQKNSMVEVRLTIGISTIEQSISCCVQFFENGTSLY
ncbi:hypothetical protein NBRC111894_1979 [Sporolactobacillus inulinus]|uniref:Uncharacterized protein n=1 Tax=Sporolactobacillus inulinus TaxID=2078 RepID=A0A4Y1ZBI4_9BACL|nr:hypothetical protein NBRC111894_1979 [Sporolactobacillus inulinus]